MVSDDEVSSVLRRAPRHRRSGRSQEERDARVAAYLSTIGRVISVVGGSGQAEGGIAT